MAPVTATMHSEWLHARRAVGVWGDSGSQGPFSAARYHRLEQALLGVAGFTLEDSNRRPESLALVPRLGSRAP